ncbi:putative pectinesterase 29 [Prunus yedoensis var. nudiflora]|uniref:pectinesterase n=1 Tax=Prunus yedoensis var. nudiflora TaxID=2094558 RepID=A0A314U7N7_PRUYE|nr:putative pectinesterase 29 [Prunus yedoensis var. nudiflora]
MQQAIDSIPENNSMWIRILIKHGVYKEKVVIPKEKPYIILEGEANQLTSIEFGEGGNVVESPTFKLFADNFVARNIIFKNTYNNDMIKLDDNGKKTTWAPAAFIGGDKASFHNCGFIGMQDTLSDAIGRHYFYNCTVVGAIDFIFSNGQSIYEKCQLKSVTDKIGVPGFITAQGRKGLKETSGYVFKDCYVNGTGPIFLGRPYRNYSRVLFASTYMENIITPEGWSTWDKRSLNFITFSEVNCKGPGADMSHRVPWEKKLSDQEVAYLTNPASFIDQEGWLGKQPN